VLARDSRATRQAPKKLTADVHLSRTTFFELQHSPRSDIGVYIGVLREVLDPHAADAFPGSHSPGA
jgi:hypothetical protein